MTDWAGHSSTGSRRASRCRAQSCIVNYQLNLEDADLISEFARVLFVDATKDPAVSSFSLTRPEPKLDFSFTSHAISVPSILATCEAVLRVPSRGLPIGDPRLRVGTADGADRASGTEPRRFTEIRRRCQHRRRHEVLA